MKIKGIKWYWWLVIILIPLMVGIGWGSASKERVVIKEVPVIKEVVKEVAKECDYTNWKALKSKDDEIIAVASNGFTIVSEIFDAISRFDTTTVEKKTAELERLSDQMFKLAPERQAILQKLGY